MSWRTKSENIQSKGSAYKALGLVKSLGDLHEARSVHDSQFFTPEAVTDFIWNIVDPLSNACAEKTGVRRVPLFDNSIGSGALISRADPEKHSIYGCDIDRNCLDALEADLSEAGFSHNLIGCSIAELRAYDMGIGIINPPFSIHLASPALEAGKSTCFGKYGPDTHANSHDYALEQALRACQVVIAVLPTSFANELEHNRLIEVVDLEPNAFKDENANVRTSVAIFGLLPQPGSVNRVSQDAFDLDALLSRIDALQPQAFRPNIRHYRYEQEEQTILTPVTGDTSVRVYRSKNRIKLKFECGFIEARVLNALYQSFIDESLKHRKPSHLTYKGEGALYLPFYFTSKDPLGELDYLCAVISDNGGRAEVCPQLIGYIRNTAKKYAKQLGGYARWVKSSDVTQDFGIAENTFSANPKIFPAPIIKEGERVDFLNMDGAEWTVQLENGSKVIALRERIQANIRIEQGAAEWKRIGTSMAERFPEQARATKARCKKLGVLEYCSWDYQQEDLIDSLIGNFGSVIAAQQGLGKTRTGYALAVASGSSRSLIITLPQLLDQFIEEAESIGVEVNVIQDVNSIEKLGAVNLITTSRLRCTLHSKTKRTYAKALRNRFGTIILDEADLLRNTATQQTRAINQLGGVKKFALSGTPIANYPRNVIGVGSWIFGTGNVIQPFSDRLAFPSAEGLRNCDYVRRGIDVFSERHVVMEWATNAFRESLQDGQGAKREIPAINNLKLYREYLSRMVIRRVREEPMVSKYFPKIDIEEFTHTVKWDKQHLAHYLTVADEFKEWFIKAKGEADAHRKNMSLLVLLARIGAVTAACNHPQFPTKNSRAFFGVNAKVDELMFQLAENCSLGEKSIVFLESPNQARFLVELAERAGISSILLAGDVDQKTRTTQLNHSFRNGEAMVCFATYGVARYGLNIPEAEHVFLFERKWSHTDEQQAIYRVLRPQQTKSVKIHYIHHEGSIDEYQAQMVAYKKEAAASGLDYAEPALDSGNFLHMDHILGQFVKDLAEKLGVCNSSELRQLLAS